MKPIIKGWSTRGAGQPLCTTCKYYNVIRGAAESEEIHKCYEIDFPKGLIPFPVYECRYHVERGKMSLYEMKQEAWLINIEREKRYGFDNDTVFTVIKPHQRSDEDKNKIEKIVSRQPRLATGD